jgi:hypothetical protein
MVIDLTRQPAAGRVDAYRPVSTTDAKAEKGKKDGPVER